MPQFGSGIIPSGALGNQLSYVTRRAFVPSLITQFLQASPTLAMLFAHAKPASGGVSPITVPVQGNAITTGGWTDYSGSFPAPQVQTGILNAEFNLKALFVPIPVYGFQAVVQMNETVIGLLDATMNDAGNTAITMLTSALFNNSTNAQAVMGFPAAINNSGTYGGISQTANTWFQSTVLAEGAVAPTRDSVLLDIIKVASAAGGESPTFAVTGPLTWHKLATDFAANERYLVTPDGTYADNPMGARGLFSALTVGPTPVYFDSNATEGTIYYVNDNYLSLYIHENINFGLMDFESTLINNQIGYLGGLLTLLELVNAKPSSCGVATGYTHS